MNSIQTVTQYKNHLISKIICGPDILFYIGNNIHRTFSSLEDCYAMIDAQESRVDTAYRTIKDRLHYKYGSAITVPGK